MAGVLLTEQEVHSLKLSQFLQTVNLLVTYQVVSD